MAPSLYIERALFVVGDQNTGKSTQIRSMFLDRRLGMNGNIPDAKRIAETYVLSHERSLYVRITSPNEWGETLEQFLDKVASKTGSGRWCVVSPLQPLPEKKMPGLVDTIKGFIDRFSPERIRVCFLSPDYSGNLLSGRSDLNINAIIDDLWRIQKVECVFIDARSRTQNGLILTDFLDFA